MKLPSVRPLPIINGDLRRWETLEDWNFYYRFNVIIIKAGFIFDGATIPRFFRQLYSPTGYLFVPGLIHDYCYQYGHYKSYYYGPIFNVPVTRKQADYMFLDISEKHFPKHRIKSRLAYYALRLRGGQAWDEYRKVDNAK